MSENISHNYVITFQEPEQWRVQRMIQAQDIIQFPGSESHHTFITQQGDIGEKIRAYHSVQNTLISQQRTSQMIHCPPPRDFNPWSALGLFRWTRISEKLVRGLTHFLYTLDCTLCLTSGIVTVHHYVYACT